MIIQNIPLFHYYRYLYSSKSILKNFKIHVKFSIWLNKWIIDSMILGMKISKRK